MYQSPLSNLQGHKVPELLQDITEATPIRVAGIFCRTLHRRDGLLVGNGAPTGGFSLYLRVIP